MTRVMLVYTILLLLPFLIFGGWRWIAKGARGHKEIMSDAPVLVLLLLGILLLGGGLYFLASKEQTGIGGVYHPAVIKDGKIIPGHFEQPSQPLN
ncbi:MAG: hypothetical protein GY927_09945 [bacterium]|nr:hypothetical protein [bacterium]